MPAEYFAQFEHVGIRLPSAADRAEFSALSADNREFLYPWIDPPSTVERFDEYLLRRQRNGDGGGLVCDRASGKIVGVINVSCIVRGHFESAFLGY